MSSNFTTNYIPVGIGYDADGNAKGLIELSSVIVTTAVDSLAFINVTGDYTVAASDRILYITVDVAVTIDLPAVASSNNRVLTILNQGSDTTTIDGSGAETINGATTTTLTTPYSKVTIHCDGAAWYII